MNRDFDEFELTEAHVKLLRRANVTWWCCEFGAPAIDGKRPYGNGDVFRDLAEILGFEPGSDEDDPWEPVVMARMDRLHRETETALQVVLASGSFAPGHYRAPKYTSRWERAPEESEVRA